MVSAPTCGRQAQGSASAAWDVLKQQACVYQDGGLASTLFCTQKGLEEEYRSASKDLAPTAVAYRAKSVEEARAFCSWVAKHGSNIQSLSIDLSSLQPTRRGAYRSTSSEAPGQQAVLESDIAKALQTAAATGLGLRLQSYRGTNITSSIIAILPIHLTSLQVSLDRMNPTGNTQPLLNFAGHLNKLQQLQSIHLTAESGLYNPYVQRWDLEKLQTLTSLTLGKGSTLYGTQAQFLPAHLRYLHIDDLSCSPYSHQQFISLQHLTALTELSTGKTLRLSDILLPPNLIVLRTADNNPPNPVLRQLGQLRILQLYSNTTAPSPDPSSLLQQLPALQELHLSYWSNACNPAGDQGLRQQGMMCKRYGVARAAASWCLLPLRSLEFVVAGGTSDGLVETGAVMPLAEATLGCLGMLTGLTRLSMDLQYVRFQRQFEVALGQLAGSLKHLHLHCHKQWMGSIPLSTVKVLGQLTCLQTLIIQDCSIWATRHQVEEVTGALQRLQDLQLLNCTFAHPDATLGRHRNHTALLTSANMPAAKASARGVQSGFIAQCNSDSLGTEPSSSSSSVDCSSDSDAEGSLSEQEDCSSGSVKLCSQRLQPTQVKRVVCSSRSQPQQGQQPQRSNVVVDDRREAGYSPGFRALVAAQRYLQQERIRAVKQDLGLAVSDTGADDADDLDGVFQDDVSQDGLQSDPLGSSGLENPGNSSDEVSDASFSDDESWDESEG